MRALKKFQRSKDEAARQAAYRACPAKDYSTLSGRHARVLIDQAFRYGVPCSGAEVNLGAVLRWFHDFLAKNAHRLDQKGEISPSDRSLADYREAMTRQKLLEIADQEDQIMPITEVHEFAGTLVGRLVQVLSNIENAIASEFGLWLADPKIGDLPTDERTRMIREFVRKNADDLRRLSTSDIKQVVADFMKEKADDGA